MKGTLRIITIGAVVLSSIGAMASPAVHGQPQTNQVAAASSLERLRQRLGANDANPLSLLKRNEWEKGLGAPAISAPAFTVEDGAYKLLTPLPDPGNAPQFSTLDMEDDFKPAPKRVHIAFSYPSAFRARDNADIAFVSAPGPEVDGAMAPQVFDRPGAASFADTSAWSDGVSKTAAEELDGYIPAEAALRTTAKPNVIIPEPSEWILFAVFGGALLVFSNRRVAARRAA